MNNTSYKTILIVALTLLLKPASAQYIATFDSLLQSANDYIDGSGAPVEGSFASGQVHFYNAYQTAYGGYWSTGWAYSNVKNDTLAGFGNIYAAYAAQGNAASSKYAVGQQSGIMALTPADVGKPVKGMYVTNGTFAGLSMKNGDAFAKKFGGVSGNDPDYFVLTIRKYTNGVLGADSVNVYLADFRDNNNSLDYIVKDWKFVDLTSLGNVDSLYFVLSSSDNGQFGMNTPAFFCVDDIITDSDTADFENLYLQPNTYWNKRSTSLSNMIENAGFMFRNRYSVASWGDSWSGGYAISTMNDTVTSGYENIFSSYAGSGYNSMAYAVAQQNAKVILPSVTGLTLKGVYITNSTYAALSMKNGDAFAKKFGGVSGNDSDWFKVSFVGYQNGVADTVEAYLADFRFADNTQDYIVKEWKWVDLSGLGDADSITTILTSSDNGQFGMNTPAFFAIDNLEMEQSTGISTEKVSLPVTLYPNPATDVVTIETQATTTVTIFNIAGQLVKTQTLAAGANTVIIDELETGVYILRLESNGVVGTRKLIVE